MISLKINDFYFKKLQSKIRRRGKIIATKDVRRRGKVEFNNKVR